MTIWHPASIDEEPVSYLHQWFIFETPEKDRHFCGYCGEGRVSSKIVEFDENKMQGKTQSGRVYQLVGPKGVTSDSIYVFDKWLRINNLKEEDIRFVEDYNDHL